MSQGIFLCQLSITINTARLLSYEEPFFCEKFSALFYRCRLDYLVYEHAFLVWQSRRPGAGGFPPSAPTHRRIQLTLRRPQAGSFLRFFWAAKVSHQVWTGDTNALLYCLVVYECSGLGYGQRHPSFRLFYGRGKSAKGQVFFGRGKSAKAQVCKIQ